MVTSGQEDVKHRFRVGVACPVREHPSRRYGATYNSINDDGGVRRQGRRPGCGKPPPSVLGEESRASSIRAMSHRDHSPCEGNKVITAMSHVPSVPGIGRGATHDTQNGPKFTEMRYPAHLPGNPAFIKGVVGVVA